MREITEREMEIVCGGFFPAFAALGVVIRPFLPFLMSAVINGCAYGAKKMYHGEPMTGQGFAISMGFGLAGGAGATLGKATSCTVGQALWQINSMPITMAGQEIAAQY